MINIFRNLLALASAAVLAFPGVAAHAHNNVVVVPLLGGTGGGGGTSSPLKNVVTVSAKNGMFTDPVAAVNSITDASETNPYLVVIGPGNYTLTQTLQMKEHVHLAGSGQNVTRLTGTISSGSPDGSSALVRGANETSIGMMTIENIGDGAHTIAFYNEGIDGTLDMYSLILEAKPIAVSTSTNKRGLYNNNSDPILKQVTAVAEGKFNRNTGIYNTLGSDPYLDDVVVRVNGFDGGSGSINIGILNDENSKPVLRGATVDAKGSNIQYAVAVEDGSEVTIRRSTLRAAANQGGTTSGLHLKGSGKATVSQSTLIGGVTLEGGASSPGCVAVDDGDGTALGSDCT